MIAFPTWQTFQSGISDAMSAGASAKAISAAAGETVELQLAALAAAASAVVPSDVAADGTGITYRGFGKFPCVSTVFDWRDGTLAPEAQWPQLIDDEMCTTSTKAVANVILSERRNTNDTDMACDGSSLYARSRFLVGYPLYEDLTSGDVADDWGETAQRFEDEDDFRWDMAAHIDVEVTKYSATPAKARAAATGPSGDKQLNIFWVATLGGNTFALFMADFVYSLFSILFIFVYLWFNVGSLVLALAGLFEIICSFPLALFFWRKIMGQNNIDFLTFVGVFLILCVGADDMYLNMNLKPSTSMIVRQSDTHSSPPHHPSPPEQLCLHGHVEGFTHCASLDLWLDGDTLRLDVEARRRNNAHDDADHRHFADLHRSLAGARSQGVWHFWRAAHRCGLCVGNHLVSIRGAAARQGVWRLRVV